MIDAPACTTVPRRGPLPKLLWADLLYTAHRPLTAAGRRTDSYNCKVLVMVLSLTPLNDLLMTSRGTRACNDSASFSGDSLCFRSWLASCTRSRRYRFAGRTVASFGNIMIIQWEKMNWCRLVQWYEYMLLWMVEVIRFGWHIFDFDLRPWSYFGTFQHSYGDGVKKASDHRRFTRAHGLTIELYTGITLQ